MTQVQEAEPQARQTMSALPQPVIRQAVMAVPIVADLVILLSRGDLGKLSPYYAVGIAVFFAATVVSAVLPRHVSSAGLILVIPFLDLGAIGLMRLVPDGNGLGLLAVLPAMWLAVDLRLRGVVLALVGILGLITVPSLLYFGYEASWWSRGLLIPIISTMVGLTAVGTVQVWSRQNQELEEQGKRLEEALRQTTEDRALNEAVVKAVDIGLVALDRTGAYRYVNPKQQGFLDLAFPEGHLGRAGQTGFVFAPDRVRRMVPEDMPSTRAMKGEEFTDHLM